MASENLVRTQPHSLEMEESVLGGMLLSEDGSAVAMGILQPKHFYATANKYIYEAMVALSSEGDPVDTLTVINHLTQKGNLEKVGGAYYIDGLQDAIPSAANIEYYCNEVLVKANARFTLEALHKATEGIYNHEMTAEQAQGEIFNLSENIDTNGGYRLFGDHVDQALDKLDMIKKHGMMPGTPLGYKDVDKICGGGSGGDLIIIAGRPSMGKTSFAMGIAENLVRSGRPGGIASIESGVVELLLRSLLQARSNDDETKIHEGFITDEALALAREKAEELRKLPLYFDDSGFQHIDQIRARARMLKSRYNIEFMLVDYLQLIGGSKADSRRLEIGEYTRKLKRMARDLDIFVICLSQLSRAPELRSAVDKRPIMSDLRETGDIEQDADKILFLYRPEYYNIATEPNSSRSRFPGRDNENLCEVIVAKHRNGPTGIAELTFLEKKAQFLNRAQFGQEEFSSSDMRAVSVPPPDSDFPF